MACGDPLLARCAAPASPARGPARQRPGRPVFPRPAPPSSAPETHALAPATAGPASAGLGVADVTDPAPEDDRPDVALAAEDVRGTPLAERRPRLQPRRLVAERAAIISGPLQHGLELREGLAAAALVAAASNTRASSHRTRPSNPPRPPPRAAPAPARDARPPPRAGPRCGPVGPGSRPRSHPAVRVRCPLPGRPRAGGAPRTGGSRPPRRGPAPLPPPRRRCGPVRDFPESPFDLWRNRVRKECSPDCYAFTSNVRRRARAARVVEFFRRVRRLLRPHDAQFP